MKPQADAEEKLRELQNKLLKDAIDFIYNPIRLCKECRYFEPEKMLCKCPIITTDYVLGIKTEPRMAPCVEERKAYYAESYKVYPRCGPQGWNWEAIMKVE